MNAKPQLAEKSLFPVKEGSFKKEQRAVNAYTFFGFTFFGRYAASYEAY